MLVNAHWLAIAFFLGPLLLPPILYMAHRRASFTAAVSVLIPLEVLAAFLAQYTLIGVSSLFALFLLWANVIPVGLQFLQHKFVSWILLCGIALATLVPQMRLGVCLLKLESEAQKIIVYCYDYKFRTGTFPADLGAYSWRHADLSNHFSFHGHGTDDKFTYPFKEDPRYDRDDKFSLRFFVGNGGTAYWYSSKKGWFVEDD